MQSVDEVNEQVKEVYARFGVALYFAQVLEHGIVNALVVLDLIPSRRHLVRTAKEWKTLVDAFMSRHFESTMGRLIRDLRSVTSIPADLEEILQRALAKRNWLAHEYFRERSVQFMSAAGRESMIHESDECRELFSAADDRLEEVIRPLQIAAGMTDEMVAKELEKMKAEADSAG
jgi:hypothetical protein